MIEEIAGLILGLGSGLLSGLFPGIHLNTISQWIVRLEPSSELAAVFFIVAMNTMHTYCDFIPSILLGAPNESNYLTALPGHKLFLRGKALDAIEDSITGALIGTGIAILFIPVFLQITEQTKTMLPKLIPIVLILTTIGMIHSEKTTGRKIAAVLVTILSATLGELALHGYSDALFPLVTGFFGISTLSLSYFETHQPKPQRLRTTPMPIGKLFFPAVLGSLGGSLVSLFPAIGPSQAAFTVSRLKKTSTRQFLVLLSSLSSASMIYSFVALFALNKARTGSAAALQSITTFSLFEFETSIGIILLCTGIAGITSLFLSRRLLSLIQSTDFRSITIGTIGLLLLLVFWWHGWNGLLLCLTATSIGILCPRLHIKRSHCMAFLVLPTLLYYIRF